jgi:hypothetical protein
MAKAHMTKLGWYEAELDKLIALGYAPAEAHNLVKDRLESMANIEWWEGDNDYV